VVPAARDAAVLPRPRAGAPAGGAPLGHAAGKRDPGAVDARDRQGPSALARGLYGRVERGVLEKIRARDGPPTARQGGDPADVRCPLRAEARRERREGGRAARWLTGGRHGEAPVRRLARGARGFTTDAGRADRDGGQAHRRRTLEDAGGGVPATRRGSRGAGGAGR